MKLKLWTLCPYSHFWHPVRRPARHCPHCGADLRHRTHPTQPFEGNPNPLSDPKEADTPSA